MITLKLIGRFGYKSVRLEILLSVQSTNQACHDTLAAAYGLFVKLALMLYLWVFKNYLYFVVRILLVVGGLLGINKKHRLKCCPFKIAIFNYNQVIIKILKI